jgi:hypothetical protein
MKDIGGWIFGIVMLFFAVANNVFLTKEIEHLQNRLNTCIEWNEMFLQVITNKGE